VLSVSERKAGRKANCPKCAEPLVVPEKAAAELQMAERRAQRATVPDDDEEPDPYTQFAVYDDEDEMELVYESEPEAAAESRPVEQNLVAVPRLVLYVQGVMLGVVALVSFALGVIVGGSSGGDRQTAGQPIPCAIDGTVSITTSTFQVIPDDGAQVFALPVGRTPEPRAKIEGLRPEDAPPEADHEGLAALRSIAGGYARTNAEGRFHLSLPDVGDYYLLVVSRRASRSGGEPVPIDHMAQLGSYFQPPVGELVGDRKYSLQLQRVTGNTPLEVVLK
jgi:hypothetical protein